MNLRLSCSAVPVAPPASRTPPPAEAVARRPHPRRVRDDRTVRTRLCVELLAYILPQLGELWRCCLTRTPSQFLSDMSVRVLLNTSVSPARRSLATQIVANACVRNR
jgi:hypothetical protein